MRIPQPCPVYHLRRRVFKMQNETLNSGKSSSRLLHQRRLYLSLPIDGGMWTRSMLGLPNNRRYSRKQDTRRKHRLALYHLSCQKQQALALPPCRKLHLKFPPSLLLLHSPALTIVHAIGQQSLGEMHLIRGLYKVVILLHSLSSAVISMDRQLLSSQQAAPIQNALPKMQESNLLIFRPPDHPHRTHQLLRV